MDNRWAPGSIALAAVLGAAVAGIAPAHAGPPAPAAVTATKAVAGTFEEGGTITYTIVLTNGGGVAAGDDPADDELVDVLPAGLALVSATATSGTPTVDLDLNRVTWNGAFVVGTVTITIDAVIQPGTEGDDLLNQASVSFDADADGTNDTDVLTDDDPVALGAQETVLTVAAFDPTVTIEQALVQPDPADSEPVRFTVEFSEPVTGFDGNDVALTGTAGSTNALVTGAAPGTTYTVLVTGAVAPGTVVVAIPAGAAVDDDDNASEASTSVDAQVTLTAIGSTTTTSSPSSTTSTSTGPVASTSTTTAAVGAGSLARTGSDEDGPLVAFLGYWLALGGAAAVAAAGWHRRRAN